MEFRTIEYMKRKDVNTDNCSVAPAALENIKKADPEEGMVLRLLIDSANMLTIEYANIISIDNIREATKLK